MVDDKSSLKMDDLEKKDSTKYNPIWKLQVTDATSNVLYEKQFVDRN